MPPSDTPRICQCEECRRDPKGFRELKYRRWFNHQTREKTRVIRKSLKLEQAGNELSNLSIPLNITQDESTNVGIQQSDLPLDETTRTILHAHWTWMATMRAYHPEYPPQTPTISFGPLVTTHRRRHLPLHLPPPAFENERDSDESDFEWEPPGPNTDPPGLRLAYLNAVSDQIVRKHAVADVEVSLRNTIGSLRISDAIPNNVTPLVTLKSVRRHLGLNTSAFLIRMSVCSECFKPYTTEEISAAEPPATCTRTEPGPCKGSYMKLVKRSDKLVPKPAKIVFYTNIPVAMRQLLMRPDFVKLLSDGAEMNKLDRAPGVLYDVCDGLAWKNARLGLRRVFRRDGTVADEPITPGEDMAVTTLGYGLFAALNIDWFKVTKKRSSGAIYLAILNIARHARFHVHNVILACVIPGPSEPSLEDLNHILQPIVEAFKKFYAGVQLKIYQENLPPIVDQPVHLYLLFLGADTPARAKATGVPFHSHEHGFGCDCAGCRRSIAIYQREGYDYQSEYYERVDEYDVLKIAKSATRSVEDRDRVAKDYGIHWSVLNKLPQWMPFSSAPFDPMHCLYLGITKDFWCDVIEDGHMLSAEQKDRFDEVFSSLEWPSQIGRLPSPFSGSLDRQKADEWRRLVSVLPFVLWVSWRLDDNTLPTGAPAIPAQTARKPTFKRNCRKLWDCAVYLTIALRLFTSWIAYLPDIDRAREYMRNFCVTLIQLGVRVKPNHHFSMHLPKYFRLYGPCYSWWLFAFERFNGILEEIRRNGHPDDIEKILAHWWIRCHLLHDLLGRLPADASDEERAVLQQLHHSYKDRGMLLAMTESVYNGVPIIQASKVPKRFLNLRGVDNTGATYYAVLRFAQSTWPHLNFVGDLEFANCNGRFFSAHQVAHPLDFVHRNNWRYGCAAASRTSANQYAIALIDKRRYPVKILQHMQLEVPQERPVYCSLVARLDMTDIPPMFWDLHSEELGYYVANEGCPHPVEVIKPEQLVSPVVTGVFRAMPRSGPQLRLVAAYDRVGHELFEEADADADGYPTDV